MDKISLLDTAGFVQSTVSKVTKLSNPCASLYLQLLCDWYRFNKGNHAIPKLNQCDNSSHLHSPHQWSVLSTCDNPAVCDTHIFTHHTKMYFM